MTRKFDISSGTTGETVASGTTKSNALETGKDLFPFVGVQLTIDALKRSPRLFAMGMGGFQERLPKLLNKMNWKISIHEL